MTEQLFNALKAIETLALGAVEVYGVPSGQGLGQSINLHSALSLGYYCLSSDLKFLLM